MTQKENRIQSFAFIVSICLCVLFSIVFYISAFKNSRKFFEFDLDNKINPNDEPAVSLIRLPSIGLQRAEAIVEYRNSLLKETNGKPVFNNIDDLQKVKGIGPATAKKISDWLKFE